MPDLAIALAPPTGFGLSWSDLGPRVTGNGPRHLYEARSTSAFDAAWTGGRRSQLREIGYGTRRGDAGWVAQFWAKPDPAAEAARAAGAARAIEASRATDAAVEIPAPEGRAYLPYQRAGIAYAMQRAGALIGDEMGLGKTIQAIGVANAMGAKRVLVVCPASLKLNWRRELAAWLVEALPVHVVEGGKAAIPDVSGGGVVVVNYDLLHVHAQALRAVGWDLVVADEAQALKNPKSRRTRFLFGGPEVKAKGKTAAQPAVEPIRATRRLLLTGTPIWNHPVDLHPLLAYLDRGNWGDFFGFAKRYCDAHRDVRGHWDFTGASNLPELQAKLRSTVMVRRLKSEVLAELPAKLRQVIPLNVEDKALRKLLAEQLAAFERREAAKAEAKDAMSRAGLNRDQEAYKEAVERLKAAQAVAFAELSRMRLEVGLAKVGQVVEHLAEIDHPVVVFAHHHEVVDAIAEAMRDAGRRVVTVTGATAVEDRQASVDAFQGGEADVIVGTLGAMSTGFTLTRSSHVVFAEFDWVDAVLSQAEDRCHRIGQRNCVHVQHLVFDGSLDARMIQAVADKKDVNDAALDAVSAIQGAEDDAPATAPTMAEVTAPVAPALDEAALREIEAEAAIEAAARAERKAAARATEEARLAAARATDAEVRARLRAALDAAGWGLDAEDHATAERLAGAEAWRIGDRTAAQILAHRLQGYVDRAAGRVAAAEVPPEHLALVADPEIRSLVLQACRRLTALDADRAKVENEVGWSKTTSWTGHWLAGQENLDQQAAAVAVGLLRIHHAQVDDALVERLFGDTLDHVRKPRRPKVVETAPEPEVPVEVSQVPEPALLDSLSEDRVSDPSAPAFVAPEPEAAPVVEEVEVEAPARSARKPKASSTGNDAARARLVLVGEAMYGPRWMADLARDLHVNDRTVRRWDSGATPIPETLWAEVSVIAKRRRDALDAVIAGLDAP